MVERVRRHTLELLAEQGLQGVSIPEVARRAELHKTSLYRRWPTREDLVREALGHALGHDTAAPDTGSLQGDLVAFLRGAVVFAESPLGRGVVRTLLGGGMELASLLAPLRAEEAQAPQDVFRRAAARGEIPAAADVDLALTVLAGSLLQRLFVEQLPADEAFLRRLAGFVAVGLGARPQDAI